MKFGKLVIFLFLIFETFFYLVTGQIITEEKSDCTKLFNFLNGDTKNYSNNCCSNISGVICDNEGYITYIGLSKGIPDLTFFPYFSRINKLYIHDALKELPNSILNLVSLKKLYLYNNNIEEIPPAIQNLSQLEELDLRNNTIKNMPNELFQLKNLKTLNLFENKIEIIPPAIQNLSQLETLHLRNNYIKILPNELFNLPNLKILGLGMNLIEVIPPAIQNLSQLEFLDLIRVYIKELPKELFELTNLNILYLGDNSIEVIPQDIQNLSKLNELELINNNIKEVPIELFKLNNLKLLDLGMNHIEVIPPGIQNLSQLEELYLDNNDIKELDSEIYKLPNLKLLNLENNPNLNTKVIKFSNSTIQNCTLNNINILCYEPDTCETVYYNNRNITNDEAKNEFNICTVEEIDEILNEIENRENLNQNDNINNRNQKNKKSYYSLIIHASVILVCIIFILIGSYLIFINDKKYKNYHKNKIETKFPTMPVNSFTENQPFLNRSCNSNESITNISYDAKLKSKSNSEDISFTNYEITNDITDANLTNKKIPIISNNLSIVKGKTISTDDPNITDNGIYPHSDISDNYIPSAPSISNIVTSNNNDSSTSQTINNYIRSTIPISNISTSTNNPSNSLNTANNINNNLNQNYDNSNRFNDNSNNNNSNNNDNNNNNNNNNNSNNNNDNNTTITNNNDENDNVNDLPPTYNEVVDEILKQQNQILNSNHQSTEIPQNHSQNCNSSSSNV